MWLFSDEKNTQDGVTDLQSYDPEKRKWTKLAQMPTKRAGTCAVSVGNKIIAMGGVAVDQKPLEAVEVYDTKRRQWEAQESLPEKLLGLSAVVKGEWPKGEFCALVSFQRNQTATHERTAKEREAFSIIQPEFGWIQFARMNTEL